MRFLALSLIMTVMIMAVTNYYISLVKGEYLRRSFTEMAGVSLGVILLLLSFMIGFIIRQ